MREKRERTHDTGGREEDTEKVRLRQVFKMRRCSLQQTGNEEGGEEASQVREEQER